MSITQHQFDQLSEMGISLWQSRSSEKNSEQSPSRQSTNSYQNIDLKYLSEQQFFCDILLASGLSIGEVTQQNDHLNLGMFDWYFIDGNNEEKIQWQEQKLFTPAIEEIAKSTALKRQLWQILSSQAQ